MWNDQCKSHLGSDVEATPPRNLLLRSLPRREFERLSPFLREVSLTSRRVLQHAGVPIEHLYFVEEGLVSVLAKTDQRNFAEVWLIGREGVIGSEAILGTRASTLSHFVQIGGGALRVGIEDLNRAMSESPGLRAVLHGYVHAALMQSSQSAACSLRHILPQRLARWLLTAQDRSELDELPITQDMLARSLGVHRPTVSGAFKHFERRGVFARERGLIRIVDRGSLERIACRCYNAMCFRRDGWKRSETRRMLLLVLSSLAALCEIELLAQ
jgi:CRP-like cAMP-binding protein